MSSERREVPVSDWTFLSNHAHTLLVIARDPEVRLRDVAQLVGITERAVQRIVADLEEAGCLKREKTGRRNRYRLHLDIPLRHPIEQHRTVCELVSLVLTPEEMRALTEDNHESLTENQNPDVRKNDSDEKSDLE